MHSISRLKEQSTLHFLSGEYPQGHELIKQCIELEPNQPKHHINKALFQQKLGNSKIALIDLNKAISLDYLNYQAYFNLFSIQMQGQDYEPAFKNICCCLSVVHLLKAQRDGNLDEVQISIDYSFNNKEARLFKSLLKLEGKKNIEALNQINYALYLAPSHPSLRIVQEKVYRLMGMKQLKNKGEQYQKPKYDRLETNKQVPQKEKIKSQIEKLLKEFNSILKQLDCTDLLKVTNTTIKQQEKSIKQIEEVKRPSPKFYLAQVLEPHASEQNFAPTDSLKSKEDRSTTNNSEHIALASKHGPLKVNPQHPEKIEPFFVLDSSFSNLSISNISQNSNIKMGKVKANMIDFSENSKYSGQKSISNILESSISEGEKGMELKFPLTLAELKSNQKIVVTLQRTVVNDKGQAQQIQQLYQVVENNNKLELVKIVKSQ